MFLTGKRSPFLGEMKNSVVKLPGKTFTTEARSLRREPRSTFSDRLLQQGGESEEATKSLVRTAHAAPHLPDGASRSHKPDHLPALPFGRVGEPYRHWRREVFFPGQNPPARQQLMRRSKQRADYRAM